MKILVFALSLLEVVMPRSEEAYRYVYRQGRDDSCGYAVVASFLSFYAGVPVDEAMLLARYSVDDGEISFGDMKRMLSDYGFRSKGYRMTVYELALSLESVRPLIVHYDRPRDHFALVLASYPGGFVVADPAQGIGQVAFADFTRTFSGAVLAAKIGRDNGLCETGVDSIRRRVSVARTASSAFLKRFLP